MWLKALLSSIEGGFQSKKSLDRSAGPIVAASGKGGYTLCDLVWPKAEGPTASLRGEFGLCGTQVRRDMIDGEVV